MTTRKQPLNRACTATRADGQPCRAWARHDSNPPLCAAHSDPAPHSPSGPPPSEPGDLGDGHLYDHNFSDQEQARLQSLTHERSLSSEVRLIRVIVDRLTQDLGPQHDLTRADILNTVAALYKGAHMIGKLWKLQVEIEKGGDDIHPAIASALDEIGEEWNIDL